MLKGIELLHTYRRQLIHGFEVVKKKRNAMEGYSLYLEITAWSTVTWAAEMDITKWNCAYTVIFKYRIV